MKSSQFICFQKSRFSYMRSKHCEKQMFASTFKCWKYLRQFQLNHYCAIERNKVGLIALRCLSFLFQRRNLVSKSSRENKIEKLHHVELRWSIEKNAQIRWEKSWNLYVSQITLPFYCTQISLTLSLVQFELKRGIFFLKYAMSSKFAISKTLFNFSGKPYR